MMKRKMPVNIRKKLPLRKNTEEILKINMPVTPIFTWTDQQISLHIFVCVIALLALRILRLKLKNSGMGMTGERALEILRNVHAVGTLYENRKLEWSLSEMDHVSS